MNPAGATGLVGSRLVSKLVSFGHSVRVLTRDERKASKKLPYPRIKFYRPERWEEGIRGADAVINLAGQCISLIALTPACLSSAYCLSIIGWIVGRRAHQHTVDDGCQDGDQALPRRDHPQARGMPSGADALYSLSSWELCLLS